jgi:hypothetical protein
VKNLKPFPKGVSGNPSGRPKGTKIVSEMLVELLENEFQGKGYNRKQLAEVVARALVKKAGKGDVKAIKELLDRVEGKVADKLDVDVEGKLTVVVDL